METGITFVSSVPSNTSSSEHTSNSEQQLAFSSRPIVGLADCVNYDTPEFLLLFSYTLLGFFRCWSHFSLSLWPNGKGVIFSVVQVIMVFLCIFPQEEELRKGGDPKYAHLNMDLHVFIEVFGPPSEAYALMAHAMEEVKKFLVPVRKSISCII